MSILRFNENGPVRVTVSDLNRYLGMMIYTFSNLFELATNPETDRGIRRLCFRDMLRQRMTNIEYLGHCVNDQDSPILRITNRNGENLTDCLRKNDQLCREIIAEMIYNLEHDIVPEDSPASTEQLIEALLQFAKPDEFERLWNFHPLSRHRLQDTYQRTYLAARSDLLPKELCDDLWQENKVNLIAILYSYQKRLTKNPSVESLGQTIICNFIDALHDIKWGGIGSAEQREKILREGCALLRDLPSEVRPFLPFFDSLPI